MSYFHAVDMTKTSTMYISCILQNLVSQRNFKDMRSWKEKKITVSPDYWLKLRQCQVTACCSYCVNCYTLKIRVKCINWLQNGWRDSQNPPLTDLVQQMPKILLWLEQLFLLVNNFQWKNIKCKQKQTNNSLCKVNINMVIF